MAQHTKYGTTPFDDGTIETHPYFKGGKGNKMRLAKLRKMGKLKEKEPIPEADPPPPPPPYVI
jgi:hypothetical protein